MRKNVVVTKENCNGRNVKFLDRNTNTEMTRSEFVRKIEAGQYPGYHVKHRDKWSFPASNPDNKVRNNLG